MTRYERQQIEFLRTLGQVVSWRHGHGSHKVVYVRRRTDLRVVPVTIIRQERDARGWRNFKAEIRRRLA